jgi:hypothetical protein
METILSIIALAISILSGGFTLYTFYWTAARDRKQATLEVYNRLQAEVFDPINTYSPEEIEVICEDTKSMEYKILSGYLARIEHFCVGINNKIYDDKVFYSLAHGYFDGHQLRKRIEHLLNAKNTSNFSKELFYVNLYSVWDWMEKKAAKK